MRLALLLALCCMLPLVSADVMLWQVLYDPIGTESGGEAVEFMNRGTSDVDISGWRLATERSDADAIVPNGTMLRAGASYLIADTGWSAGKDNPSWRAADLEEAITLNNKDSGVALIDASNRTVDAAGWGDAEEIPARLYETRPFPSRGNGSLRRLRDSDDNAQDWEEGGVDFSKGLAEDEGFTVWLNVTRSAFDVAVDDDLPEEPGIQLRPRPGVTRVFRVRVPGAENASAEFLDATVRIRNGTADLTLPFATPPGEHLLRITQGDAVSEVRVSVLALRAASIVGASPFILGVPGRPAILKAAAVVRNMGNVAQDVLLEGSGAVTAALLLQVGSDAWLPLIDVPRVTLRPGESVPVGVRVDVPQDAAEGMYKTVIRVRQN